MRPHLPTSPPTSTPPSFWPRWRHLRNIRVTVLPCQVLASLPLFLSGKAHRPGQAFSSHGRQVTAATTAAAAAAHLAPSSGHGMGQDSRAERLPPSQAGWLTGHFSLGCGGSAPSVWATCPEPLMPASALAFPRRARPLERGIRDWAPRVSAALVEMAAELEEPRPRAVALGSQSCDNRPCSMIMFFFMRT